LKIERSTLSVERFFTRAEYRTLRRRGYAGQASNIEIEDAFGEGAERDRRGACATKGKHSTFNLHHRAFPPFKVATGVGRFRLSAFK
jgi:hypothetical protein